MHHRHAPPPTPPPAREPRRQGAFHPENRDRIGGPAARPNNSPRQRPGYQTTSAYLHPGYAFSGEGQLKTAKPFPRIAQGCRSEAEATLGIRIIINPTSKRLPQLGIALRQPLRGCGVCSSHSQGSPRRLGQPWAIRGNGFAVKSSPSSPLNGYHPGGMTDISRWLSEAWRATPPETKIIKNTAPRRGARCDTHSNKSGIPPGCGGFLSSIPVVSLAKPRSTTGYNLASLRLAHSPTPLNGHNAEAIASYSPTLPESARAILGFGLPKMCDTVAQISPLPNKSEAF